MKKRNGMKQELEKSDISRIATHPVVKEFESLFAHFPQLFSVLSKETVKIKDAQTILGDAIPPKRRNEEINMTPRKRHSTANVSLDNHALVEHKMFDKSIADMIDTEILTSPSKRRLKLKSKSGSKDLHQRILLENVYRMFGITFFPVVDPNDIKMNEDSREMEISREMTGIRLEVFNDRLKKFENPHYILLKKKIKSDSWLLFKHTVPNYIDSQTLFDNTNGGLVITYDHIYFFAKSVYLQLILVSLRSQQLEELADVGLITDLVLDLQAAVVSFSINECKIRLFLKNDQVVSCFISDDKSNSQRKLRLEVILLGPINDLTFKLKHLND